MWTAERRAAAHLVGLITSGGECCVLWDLSDRSTAINRARLRRIAAQEQVVNEVCVQSQKQLAAISSDGARYKELLTNLIVQVSTDRQRTHLGHVGQAAIQSSLELMYNMSASWLVAISSGAVALAGA